MPKLEMKDFNVQADVFANNYHLLNFRSTNFNWFCRLEDESNMTVISADLEYVLQRLAERGHPIGKTNLDFALGKMKATQPALPAPPTKDDPWIERIEAKVKMLCKVLPNLELRSLAKGEDYMVVRCNSKSQAKKMMKTVLFRNTGKYTDRSGDRVCIQQIQGAKA